jgi:pre-mRNA-processing factor SLU7
VEEEKFMRASGDAAEFERAQRAAWESQEQGAMVKQHLQANPTEAQYYQKKAREEAEAKKEAQKKMLLEKYGGQEHLQAAPLRDAAVTESERYVEYDASGGIKGAPKTIAKSKYPEDKLINNHTSVWGSWWKNFQWGYACCHSMVKNSYCTGEEGIRAFDEAHEMRLGGALPIEPGRAIEDGNADGSHEELDIRTKPEANGNSTKAEGSKKRGLDEMKAGVSEEDLEEYRKKRMVANDPMAHLLGKDEILT